MGLFNKLFGDKSKPGDPDNTKLLELLAVYWKENGASGTYKNVVLELLNGNSFLIFPTANEVSADYSKWTISEKDTILKLTSFISQDGLRVLGVFTDEAALINWRLKPSQYTAMRSQDVLKFAGENGMDRIVINSGQPNMFVIERSRENVKEHQIEQNTVVQFGTPAKPLNNSITQKLIAACRKNDTISEVYHYDQTNKGEFSLVIGFKLSINSDNAKKAAVNIVQNAMLNETLKYPLDVFFIETDEWYKGIKGIENSLLYKKED